MTRVAVPAVSGPLARPRDTRRCVLRGSALGTTWSVVAQLPGDMGPGRLQDAVEATLAAVDAEMSGWRAESELSRFNRAQAGSWHPLSAGHFAVVQAALDIAAATEGAFDPCLGAAADRWGFGPSGPVACPPAACPPVAILPDWRRLQLRPADTALLQPGGVCLDLSAIGKGHAVDRVCLALQRLGLASMLVEIGGEVRGEGVKPDGGPWWVALEVPPGLPGERAADRRTVVALHGHAVATSGDYRRHFVHDGVRFGHVLDPRRGAPARTDLAAVSVIHRGCMAADAHATALASLPSGEALALADRLGLAALLQFRDGRSEVSRAFAAML